jgi:hypothetical protein
MLLNNTTMQNQITNQLTIFGIRPGEYTITTHPTGEIEIAMQGNTVAIVPAIGRKSIVLDRQWTLDRIPSDGLVLAVSSVVAALLRCRHTEPEPSVPVLPTPSLTSFMPALPALPFSMVEKTPSPCGGEAAKPSHHETGVRGLDFRVYPDIAGRETYLGGEGAIPRLGIYPTDNHSPEEYE